MADRNLRDRMLTCSHCGVTFLWSAEEQQRAAQDLGGQAPETPHRCPGCRLLQPASGRERGLVKWFNVRKHYGFVVRPDGSDVFTHRSHFQNIRRLREGDLVEFQVEASEKGPIATDLYLLERSDAGPK